MTKKDNDGKQLTLFADEAMFVAQPADLSASDIGGVGGIGEKLGPINPKVTLLDAPVDPLGKLAYIAMAYQGKFPTSYADVSDEDRMYYIRDMEKNVLGMPSEAVMFHFIIRNVTRAFTHQLVRTRHASFAQESLRFAVKEDFPTSLPPSLHGVDPREFDDNYEEYLRSVKYNPTCLDGKSGTDEDRNRCARQLEEAYQYAEKHTSREGLWRRDWDAEIEHSHVTYDRLIRSGMPAEDARGIMPHAILTQINMAIDLRALMNMAGQRLCTQAQYEHRLVWSGIIHEIRRYGDTKTYLTTKEPRTGVVFSRGWTSDGNGGQQKAYSVSSAWQYELLADRFKPVCYHTGRCQFRSDFDRYCNIRDRVEANYRVGRESSEWDESAMVRQEHAVETSLGIPVIPAIDPQEWLRPDAAIRKTGDWRSEQAQANIKGRR